MKICIACSAGGHLTEALQLLPILKKHSFFFLTFKRKQSKELLKKYKVYFTLDPKRNFLKLLVNFLHSFLILLKERPKLIISTGAASAVLPCYIGKILGGKVVFIETLAAIYKPSLSGRIIYPIADLFIVQWKSLLKFYKKAIYGGQLI